MADNFPQLSDVLRCPQAPVDVNSINTDATPQAPGGKRETLEQFQPMAEELSELQERLFARGRNNPDYARRVLIVWAGHCRQRRSGTTCCRDGRPARHQPSQLQSPDAGGTQT